jgi:DNA-binding GntR family transcriptional regulator
LTTDGVFAPAAARQTLFAHVYDALRRAIVTGALQPGQRVNEAEVARQMQISRGPVREAIRRLEQAGLLVSVPRRGTVVVSLAAEEVEEAYTLRADLEARAIERATGRMSDADLAELEHLMQVMHAAGLAGDLPALLDADIEFHRTIVQCAGWWQLQRLWDSLHPRTLTLYTMRTLVEWSPDMHADRHLPVLDALRARDAAAAQAAIRQHILGVGLEVLRLAELPKGASNGAAMAPEADNFATSFGPLTGG